MKTPTITNEMREEILALQIPKNQRRRHGNFIEGPFRQRHAERWNWPEAITEVKTEKVISIDEILEGFNGL